MIKLYILRSASRAPVIFLDERLRQAGQSSVQGILSRPFPLAQLAARNKQFE